MTYTLLISPTELAAHLDDPNWIVVDCRFNLGKPEEKEAFYQKRHIAGAVYAHLERDLSAPVIAGQTGRHPLPTPEETAARLGALGIGPHTQVVAYDDAGGALAAGRLWWMLRWIGHANVALLNGAWQGWAAADLPTHSGAEPRPPQTLPLRPSLARLVEADDLPALLADPNWRVLDVRAAERYTGANEPIDPVAGHIPGAINAPYLKNMQGGRFRSPEFLRELYAPLLGDTPAERVVAYCGSGVTSVHTLVALEHAGLGQAVLYSGSWSDWIAPGTRPVATGEQP